MTATLGPKALGRATLARQLLLERSDLTVPQAIEHLVGLQAQTPHTWYVGLWSRLDALRPEQVSDLLEDRTLVRVALMRSTIHLVTARDCLAIRPLVQPVIERGMSGNYGKNLVGVDRDALAAAGRAVLERRPMIFSELGRELAQRYPGRDPASLAMAIRTSETLVQVTPRGLWGRSGRPAHTTARSWLGSGVPKDSRPRLTIDDLVLRYLRAFGPASARDVQTWSGLVRLGEVLDRLRSRLVVFRDDPGRELFDLPDAPRPDPDSPAQVRFLYDYDNLLLSHADRSRVVTDDDPRQRFSKNGVMPPCVLVDGVTAGSWSLDRSRAGTTLTVQPFRRWTRRDTAEASSEGLALLGFLDPGGAHDVRVLPRLGT